MIEIAKKTEPTQQLSVKLKPRDYEALQMLSAKTHKPMSEIARSYILQGMGVEKTKDDIDFIRKQIREEIYACMDGYQNRIIKLLVKIGTLTVSMCFFTSKLLYILLAGRKDRIPYDDMFNEAKKKTGAFLGLKDSSIDEVCRNIIDDKD